MTTQSEAAARPPVAFTATVILVGTLASVYIVSQFLRNSVGVIAPDLASELSMQASEVGLLSSVFFISFALAQIPLGICLDRYGPKNCMLVCTVIAVAGTALFSAGSTPIILILGRVLMGLGASCYLMAPLALYARRFPPQQFGTLAGIQLGLGSIGTLIATAPLAWSVNLMGWRASFLVVAGAMSIAGILVALVVRDDSPGRDGDKKRETLRQSLIGSLQVWRVPSMKHLFLLHLTSHSSFVMVVGLWGGPYLTHIYGYNLTERGNMLFIAAVAQVIASFLFGPADRIFRGYKLPVFAGSVLTAATFFVAAIFGKLTPTALFVWFIAIGAVTAYVPLMIAHGKSLFPPHLIGRGMTVLNMGTMGGVFLSQTVTGFVIGLFPITDGAYALDAYRAVFGLQALFVLLACIPYLWARDPWRRMD